MNLRDLSTDTMVSVSQPWSDDGEVRARIERYKPLAGLLEVTDAAHAGVLALTTRLGGKPNAARLAELTEQASECDARFDRALKGGLALADLAAMLLAEPAQRARVGADRDELYPSGASVTQSSFANQVGVGVALEGKLEQNPKLRARVGRIKLVVESAKGPAQTFTVTGLAQEQIEAARDLGAVEQKRRELEEGAPLAGDEKAKPAAVSRGRTAWIRAVGLLVDTANALPNFTDEDRRAVFGPLGKALESGLEAKRAEADEEEEGGAGGGGNADPKK